MFKVLERLWPILSILLTMAVLASIFVLPGATRLLALTAVLLSAGATILLTVRRHLQAHRQGRLSRRQLAARLAADLPGILLTMSAAIAAGAHVGRLASQWALLAAEARWPGWGLASGVLVGIVAGLAAGGTAAALIRWLWRRLTGSRQPAPAQGEA